MLLTTNNVDLKQKKAVRIFFNVTYVSWVRQVITLRSRVQSKLNVRTSCVVYYFHLIKEELCAVRVGNLCIGEVWQDWPRLTLIHDVHTA